MKIILVHIGLIDNYPPVLSLIRALNELGHEIYVITTDVTDRMNEKFKNTNIKLINVYDSYEKPASLLKKLMRLFIIKKNIWTNIDKIYDENSLIWVSHIESIKHIGSNIYTKNYIIHLFELYENIAYSHKTPFLKVDLKKLCELANRVVVSEENRAHITMAKWQLNKLPAVYPNKPYYEIDIQKESEITSSQELRELMNRLKNKKIIIYQGLISPERPLREFIKAVDKLGDSYAFVVMSNGENIYKDISSKNYYFIPYIKPPYHLEVTSHAYIGVLPYVSTYKKNFGSPLNAIYCAPNKIYEYSMFGIPMLSNNIPGLSYPFGKYGIGKCVKEIDEDQIVSAIKEIEANYNQMAYNARCYFDSVELKDILREDILTCLKEGDDI